MNRCHCGLAVVALALALAGCSGWGQSTTTPAQVDPNLYPAKYKEEVVTFLRTYLNNPAKVRDAAISVPALRPVDKETRYVACVRYNARGSENRYIGIEEKAALFWGGRLNQFLSSTPEWCANVLYQRFPEAEALVP